HAGHAGEGVAGDVVLAGGGDAAAVQAHLVPDGGQRGRQVRVVGQQGLLGDGVPAGHHPGVGADAVAVDADRGGEVLQGLLQARELALQPGAVTGRPLRSLDAGAGSGTRTGTGPVRCAADARARTGSGSGARTGAARAVAALFEGSREFVVLALGDDRLVPAVRVLRVQVGDLLRAEAARHQGPVDLVLHVAAQVPGHRLQPRHRVDRGPGLGLVVVGEAQRRVLQGDLLAVLAVEVGVDPLGVRVEILLRGGRQLLLVL